jgi:acetolactate synthase small subunit
MQEGSEGLTGARSLSSSEIETLHKQGHELVEEHNVLDDELRRLVSEEATLIAKNSAEEASFTRMEEITKREMEIIIRQKEIIDEMALRLGNMQA